MPRPMFPHAVDSTMLAAFRSCPQKMFRTYIEHWKPQEESVHLVAGKAFAEGIEIARRAYYEGRYKVGDPSHPNGWRWASCLAGDFDTAQAFGLQALLLAYGDFECPAESAKSCERMASALEYYFEQYPLGNDGMEPIMMKDGRRGIEFSFCEPLPINHPVTGAPMLYTGRADLIARFAGGTYTVDEKTTSSLGASWGRQWEMRSQFTGYQWAARKAGIEVQGTIVRGVAILKTLFNTMQVVTYRSPYEVDRWLDQTVRDIRRMIRCWEEGYWDYALDHACAEYGGCSMQRVCKSADPEAWLPMSFAKRVWDPMARKELTVEEFEASWGHVRELEETEFSPVITNP